MKINQTITLTQEERRKIMESTSELTTSQEKRWEPLFVKMEKLINAAYQAGKRDSNEEIDVEI